MWNEFERKLCFLRCCPVDGDVDAPPDKIEDVDTTSLQKLLSYPLTYVIITGNVKIMKKNENNEKLSSIRTQIK